MINPFKKKYTERENNIFVFMAKMRLFSELNYKQMAQFLPHMHERSYEQNEVVFFRNDPSHALYLLKKGQVSLNIDINDTFEYLTTVKAGNALGISSLLKDSKRLLNAVVSSEKAEFYVIPQENIFSIFEDHIKIKCKMLEALAETYNEYNSNLYSTYRSSSGFFNLQQVFKDE